MQVQQTDRLACVLDLDPDLGTGLDETDFERARAACRERLVSVPAGRFDPSAARDGQPVPVGFLILDGLVCREVKLRDQRVIELLGPGDVLQPPPREPQSTRVAGPTITVVREMLAAQLGLGFVRCAGKWPELLARLLDRIEEQHQRLVAQELIVHLRRADERVLVMLWLLANRFGYVTPEGIHLRLSLTHNVLGQLIAAQRSTVTLALRALEQKAIVRRMPGGTWMLTPKAEGAVRRSTSTTAGPPLGDTLRLLQRANELKDDAKALQAHARQITASQRTRAPADAAGDGGRDASTLGPIKSLTAAQAPLSGSVAPANILPAMKLHDRGPEDAARAAALGAENARLRVEAAAVRKSELTDGHGRSPTGPPAATDRAANATRSAEVALARAVEAHERAAEAHQDAARLHNRIAAAAEQRGDAAAAARHREAANGARSAAQRATRAALEARHDSKTARP